MSSQQVVAAGQSLASIGPGSYRVERPASVGDVVALIEQHDLGASYRDGDVAHLRKLVLAFAADPARRSRCSRNARALYESRSLGFSKSSRLGQRPRNSSSTD